jgi:hypothetical protein
LKNYERRWVYTTTERKTFYAVHSDITKQLPGERRKKRETIKEPLLITLHYTHIRGFTGPKDLRTEQHALQEMKAIQNNTSIQEKDPSTYSSYKTSENKQWEQSIHNRKIGK